MLHKLDDAPTVAATAQLGQTVLPVLDAVLPRNDLPGEVVLPPHAHDWLARLRSASEAASERATHRLSELRQLAARCT